MPWVGEDSLRDGSFTLHCSLPSLTLTGWEVTVCASDAEFFCGANSVHKSTVTTFSTSLVSVQCS